jgi:hypothetical protein
LCDKIADFKIRNDHQGQIVVGKNHDDKLVLLDTFPNGYMMGKNKETSENSKTYSTQGHNQFLCLADMGYVPPLVWVHLLRQGNKIPLLAHTMVHPESIIVTNSKAASAQRLQEVGLRALDVETLQELDTPQSGSICSNLGKQMQNIGIGIELVLGRILLCIMHYSIFYLHLHFIFLPSHLHFQISNNLELLLIIILVDMET